MNESVKNLKSELCDSLFSKFDEISGLELRVYYNTPYAKLIDCKGLNW